MDKIREMQIAIEDLQRMLKVPMSSTATQELISSINSLKKSLKDEEDQVTKGAIEELGNLEKSVINPLVALLCRGLIGVLSKPEATVNSTLIRTLFQSATKGISGGEDRPDGEVTNGSNCIQNGQEVIVPCPPEQKRPTSSPLTTKNLNIWSEEVRWDNDYNFVRIYLPIVLPHRTSKLQDVTCSMLHLELGHKLTVKYPGVTFSVLINHSTITGTVEGHLSPTQVTIRLTKTDQRFLPYLTFVSSDSTHLTFHLNTRHHLRTRKESALMMLIHRKKLDLSPLTCLPDKEYLDFIKSEHNINPLPILYEVCRSNATNSPVDLEYQVIFDCRCDPCTSLANKSKVDTQPVAQSNLDTSFFKNPIKEIHTCDVWWDNDYNYVRIYLPIVDKSHVTLDRLTCALSEFEFGHRLQVIYPGAIFKSAIHTAVDSIEVKILFDTIIIRLTKKTKGFWSYISLLTKLDEEDEDATYHVNPYYHVKVKKDTLKSLNLKNDRSLSSHLLLVLNSRDFASSDDIFDIFRETRILHDSKPSVDQGYCKLKTHKSIIWC